MIVRWSGREAHALRQAMHMSIDDFARHAKVSPRSVARWAQRGQHIRLRWDVQRLLDGVLGAAGPQVHARLTALLSEDPPPPAKVDSGPPPYEALVDVILTPAPPPAAAPHLIHLEKGLARIHMAVQSCHYHQAAAELSTLIRLLAAATTPPIASPPTAPPTAFPADRWGKLAADAFRLAADLLLKLGDLPMAMLAAQRAEQSARESAQPLAIAAATRVTVRVLTHCGRPHHAASLAETAAGHLASATDLDGPRPRSGYGSLLLGAAVAHAAAGRRGEAMMLLGEANGIAGRLGEHANYGWTAFDPANVALHRVRALLSLGDAGLALHIAKGLDPQRIRLAERRAAWHLDTARACHTLGKGAETQAALRDAAAISPDETRALAAELGLKTPLPTT